jgi:hypothetical protein
MERIDLSGPQYLCQATGGTYDADAVQVVVALERVLRGVDRHGHFGVVLNAIEYMVEDRKADPRVVSHLCDAIRGLVPGHRLPSSAAKKVTTLLHQLQDRVATGHAR